MIRELKTGKYRGAIFHAVSRSGRNPKEQSQIYELMLEGYEFHFVSERLSTVEPLARNMLYMLWGMASGFSETLKAEVSKGIMGMLRNGRTPIQCPIGYRDAGKGVKEIDEKLAPLIRKGFEMYSKGDIDILTMHKKLESLGFTDKRGKQVHYKTWYKLLRHKFYYGLLVYNDETFIGAHTPIIDKALFDKAQAVLDKRGFKHKRKFEYLFSQMISCRNCGKPARSLSAKSRYKYYSCRNLECKFNLKEEFVEERFWNDLIKLEFNESEVKGFLKAVEVFRNDLVDSKQDEIKYINMELTKLKSENERLLDAYLKQDISNEDYKSHRSKNTNKEIELNERKTALDKADDKIVHQIVEIGKLLQKPSRVYRVSKDDKKVSLIKSLVENFSWEGEKLVVNWKKEFEIIKNRPQTGSVLYGSA